MANTHYLLGPFVGADLTATPTTADFAVGTRAFGNNGSEWIYVHANGAITQYDCVGIDEDYEAAAMTKTIADGGWLVGFAQVAFADNDYGWVALRGSAINCRVAASCAADVALYTTGTAGVLDDTSASQTMVNGVVAVAAGTSAGTSAREVLVTNPWTSVAT